MKCKQQTWCCKNQPMRAVLLKLIQDMPVRYVDLMPFSRIAIHRGKLPHQAIALSQNDWCNIEKGDLLHFDEYDPKKKGLSLELDWPILV